MKEIQYIQQPTEYLCGQACVAMIANVSVDDVIRGPITTRRCRRYAY